MELKEFMEIEKLSEDDIIKAASIVTKVCKNGSCKNCPLYLFENCHANDMTGDFIPATSRRFKKLLHPSKMEQVAEMLGVKFGQPFIVESRCGDEVHCYLGEEGLKLTGDKDADCRNLLGDLLAGKAYIVKEDNKDE